MSVADGVTCRDLVEALTDYLEGAIPADRRAAIDAHLATCDGCRTVLEELRTTIRITGTLSEEQVPETTRASLREAFRGWREEPTTS